MRLLMKLLIVVLVASCAWPAGAAERTFPAGSLVIPVDPCWQPPATQPSGPGCAGNGSSAGVAGAYGLAYRLQRAGIPIYLADSADPASIAFVIHGQGQAPVVELPGGEALAPPARVAPEGRLDDHLLDYRAAPFLIDGRDLDSVARALLASTPLVRRHQALVPFVAPVSRQLTGLATEVVVTDAVAAARVQSLLSLAGLTDRDGLTVACEGSPPATSALLACTADSPAAALQEGPCGLPALFADLYAVPTTTLPAETVRVAPLLADGTLYVASALFPGRRGHLRAFTLRGDGRSELWDAASGIPSPGSVWLAPAAAEALEPPFPAAGSERLLFTNSDVDQHYQLIRFDAAAAVALAPRLGSATVADAAALINAVRGRLGTSAAVPEGSADRDERFAAVSSSTPALAGRSLVSGATDQRNRVLYVGSDDGLLHAFLAGSSTAPNGDGRELWGYLPGGLLPALSRQGWADATRLATVRVDGSPAVSDQFADFDGDGRREWRTILIGTASADGFPGVVFALDVTDPYRPQLLWEKSLAEIDLGVSRGVALGTSGSDDLNSPRIFLTGAPRQRRERDGTAQPYNGQFGVLACALDLVDGRLRWEFFAPFATDAANLNAAPAPPALLSEAGKVSAVVFGDLVGRLWALDPASGAPFGGAPVYSLPGGSHTPIGAGVAVRGRTVLFGSGGAGHADPTAAQTIYAVEWLPTGARLLWSYPLASGEQLWGAPLIDRSGRAYLGISNPTTATGRLQVLDSNGAAAGSVALAGAPGDSLAVAPGLVVAVSREGVIEQIGAWQEPTATESSSRRVRVLSWRYR